MLKSAGQRLFHWTLLLVCGWQSAMNTYWFRMTGFLLAMCLRPFCLNSYIYTLYTPWTFFAQKNIPLNCAGRQTAYLTPILMLCRWWKTTVVRLYLYVSRTESCWLCAMSFAMLHGLRRLKRLLRVERLERWSTSSIQNQWVDWLLNAEWHPSHEVCLFRSHLTTFTRRTLGIFVDEICGSLS